VSRLKIIRKAAISQFANIVDIYREDAYRLWLISPWIGVYTDGSLDPLQLMMDAVKASPSCMVNVVTREPEKKAAYHHNALALLKANVNPLMFYCPTLHTKLYVLEAKGFTAAVLGSPNLTAGGNSANIELAIEIRDTSITRADEVSVMLRGLVQYAHDLILEDSVRLIE
jgi:hypothetical protein